MKKFYYIYTHDYMDMKPVREVHTVIEERLDEYVQQLRKCCNGSVSLDRALTKEEAALEVIRIVSNIIDKPICTRTDGSLDSVDIEEIKKVLNLLKESYK